MELEGIDVDTPINVPARQGASIETPEPRMSNLMDKVQSHPTLKQDGSREKFQEALNSQT